MVKSGKTVGHVAGMMDLIGVYCFGWTTEVRKTSWGRRFRLENNVEFKLCEQRCHTGKDLVLGSSVTLEKLNLQSS